MTRPILLIQLRPEDAASDNEYAAVLRYGELKVEQMQRLRIETTGFPAGFDPYDYSAIIVGGSPFDVSKPQKEKSDIQLRIEEEFRQLLGVIVQNDLPFLGICSGNGLLGMCSGTSISRKYGESISCVTVELTEVGKQDPLLVGFPDEIDVLLGHKEACDELPAGARLLMTGRACPIQMFRIGENIYSTQFHPELDPEGIALRINTYKNHGYFPAHEADSIIARVKHADTPYAQEILKRFVSRYLE